MKLKLLVATHKTYQMPQASCYLPVFAGAARCSNALYPQEIPAEYARDDAGDNISLKNKSYCELSVLYWGWKNLSEEYLGLVHYRRYFAAKTAGRRWQRIAGEKLLEKMLQKAPVLLPRKRQYYIETNYSQYVHAHHAQDLEETRSILCEQYPEYVAAYDAVMKKTSGHRFNMFVMRADLLDAYCTWLFDVLFSLEDRLDISEYSEYDQRVFGFVGERLLDCWLLTNKIDYCELPVVNLENQHWPKKIVGFLRRKFAVRKKNSTPEKVPV